MKKVVILGAGGTGLEMADTMIRHPSFSFVGFLDDDEDKQKYGHGGHAVLGKLEDCRKFFGAYHFLSSLYSPNETFNFSLKIGALYIPESRWATVIDPFSRVASDCKLGAGAFVGPGTIIQPGVVVNPCCFLNGANYISHDCRLGQYVCLANRVSLCGNVVVGDGAFLGAGSVVRQRVMIGRGAIVGMGSVVLEDVNDYETVVGNPARPI